MNALNEQDPVEPKPVQVPEGGAPESEAAEDAIAATPPNLEPVEERDVAMDDAEANGGIAGVPPQDLPRESAADADVQESPEPPAEAVVELAPAVPPTEAAVVAESAPEGDVAEVEDVAAVAETAPEGDVAEAEDVAAVAETAPEGDVPEAEDVTAVAEPEPAAGPDSSGGEQVSMMELLMAESDFMTGHYQRGELIEGRVLRKDRDQIILDVGAKQEGVVPGSDLARLAPEALAAIQVGDTVQAVVIRPEGREGEVLVSLYQARTVADWDRAQEYMDSGEVLELEIVGYNKGGVLVGFGNLQGFVPRSHMARPGSEGEDGMEGLATQVGSQAAVKVIEVSRKKRRLIMSERLAMREWRSERKKRLLDQLREGEVRKGRVSSVADFGAFVDLGGADGLVHVSELTFERGKHPRDVVRVGQEVEVYILSIDRDRKRIGLSMKRLQSDPWGTVEEEHYVGELVEATISNLSKFGAFARLDDGLEGLIHVSELSDHHVEHPRESVRPGQRVTVEIIAIEPDRQRIGLSIRRVPPHLRTVEEPEPEPEPVVAPEPTEPEWVEPEATALEPGETEATELEPGEAEATELEPGEAETTELEPGEAETTELEPDEVVPTEPELGEFESAEPEPSDVVATDPELSEVESAEPAPEPPVDQATVPDVAEAETEPVASPAEAEVSPEAVPGTPPPAEQGLAEGEEPAATDQ